MINFFWNILRHIGWATISKAPLSKKDILITYLILKLKYVLGEKLLRLKITNQNILGFDVTCVDYNTLIAMYEEIFIHNIYFFHTQNKRPLIIDCGSHIGMSIIFFKKIYPASRIIAFEPEENTFEILKKNIQKNQLKNVVLNKKALYKHQGQITLYSTKNNSALGTGTIMRTKPQDTSQKVSATTLSEYIKGKVDHLKLDVEGSELPIINQLARTNKLRLVQNMSVEYHHHLNPEEDNLSKFLAILENNGFGYQLNAYSMPPWNIKKSQSIIINAYRKN